jgi:hypothetical protein
MPISHSIWKVSANPTALPEGLLPSEALLEDMIVARPAILSNQWMIIGRQVSTGYGGRIDLLALAPDASLVLIELKRGKTPREVVAQAIDYACWAEDLDADEISRVYLGYSGGGSLSQAFRERFGQALDEDALNESHQIVIVASQLDASSERIVSYLNKRDIAINVLCFQVFEHSEGQLLSRSWLHDPVETQVAASVGTSGGARSADREPWNGEYYVNFGEGESRSWADATRYGFISAGGGSWYSGTLNLLHENDRIWVRVPQQGYVGVGRVIGEPVHAADFKLRNENGLEKPALEILTNRTYHRNELAGDGAEYFVRVEWLETVPLEKAVHEVGMFGNQNTVCAPRKAKWRHTIERLKEAFPRWDSR